MYIANGNGSLSAAHHGDTQLHIREDLRLQSATRSVKRSSEDVSELSLCVPIFILNYVLLERGSQFSAARPREYK